MDLNVFISAFEKDKKHVNGNYSVILPGGSGLNKYTSVWNSEARNQILHSVVEIVKVFKS
jgi:hypothetical protein